MEQQFIEVFGVEGGGITAAKGGSESASECEGI
jgi:hypothetical protein